MFIFHTTNIIIHVCHTIEVTLGKQKENRQFSFFYAYFIFLLQKFLPNGGSQNFCLYFAKIWVQKSLHSSEYDLHSTKIVGNFAVLCKFYLYFLFN